MRWARVVAVAAALVAAGCGGSPNPTAASGSKTVTASVSEATTTSNGVIDLRALIPTPAGAQRTDGPDTLADNGTGDIAGIHLHFLVTGSPSDVMAAYKDALEGAHWAVTVQSSGGSGGGGGATYTGTNGAVYGVFSGGGYASSTDIDACAWPVKPANPQCGRHG